MNELSSSKVSAELQAFAERIGLETLELNEDGYCALESDKGEVIHLQWERTEEAGCLELSALVGSLSVEAATGGFRLLLEANFARYGSAGGWFAVRPESDEVWYFYRLEGSQFTGENLEAVTAGCLEQLTRWQEQLSQVSQPRAESHDSVAGDSCIRGSEYVNYHTTYTAKGRPDSCQKSCGCRRGPADPNGRCLQFPFCCRQVSARGQICQTDRTEGFQGGCK